MEDLKVTFARNLIMLRKQLKITQLELAEKLHYSDKAVSKWERGESIPDVSVLKVIANLFGVTIDFLVTEHENEEIAIEQTNYAKEIRSKNHLLIWAITFFSLIFFEIIVFIALQWSSVASLSDNLLFCFVYPLPLVALVATIFSSVWAKKPLRIISVSALIWSLVLDAVLIVELASQHFIWAIFLVGIPAELIALFGFKFKSSK